MYRDEMTPSIREYERKVDRNLQIKSADLLNTTLRTSSSLSFNKRNRKTLFQEEN